MRRLNSTTDINSKSKSKKYESNKSKTQDLITKWKIKEKSFQWKKTTLCPHKPKPLILQFTSLKICCSEPHQKRIIGFQTRKQSISDHKMSE